MGVVIPLVDEAQDLAFQILKTSKARGNQALALDDGEPLLDLVHPGAVHRREVEPEPRMPLEPGLDLFTPVGAYVVADDMDDLDRSWGSAVYLFEKFNDFTLAFSLSADPDSFTSARIEGGQQVQRPLALILMFEFDRYATRRSGLGLGWTWSWLERGLLVHAEHLFLRPERTRVQVHDVERLLPERFVTRYLAAEPVVDAPGLELLRQKNPLDRLGRNVLDDLIALERPGQLGAGPQRQRTTRVVRQFAGQLDQVRGHLGGKSGLGARCEVHQAGP